MEDNLKKILVFCFTLNVFLGCSQTGFLGKNPSSIGPKDTIKLMVQQRNAMKNLSTFYRPLIDTMSDKKIRFEYLLVSHCLLANQNVVVEGLAVGDSSIFRFSKRIPAQWDKEAIFMDQEFRHYALYVTKMDFKDNVQILDTIGISIKKMKDIPWYSVIEDLLSHDSTLNADYPLSKPFLMGLGQGVLKDKTVMKHSLTSLFLIDGNWNISNYYETPFKSFGHLGNHSLDDLFSSFQRIVKK